MWTRIKELWKRHPGLTVLVAFYLILTPASAVLMFLFPSVFNVCAFIWNAGFMALNISRLQDLEAIDKAEDTLKKSQDDLKKSLAERGRK